MRLRRALVSAPVLAAGLTALAGVPSSAALAAQELDAPRPIEALNSVWIEELTWMEVRDEIASGKTTAIISTGGVEPNGPYVATGKHNFVLESACEWLARDLGDALCAPIVKLVPEGNIDPPSGHMRYPGTISVRQETFEAILEDVGRSLAAHGFTDIVYIGDSGGNARGMRNVATMLTEEWAAAGRSARAHHIGEFYNYSEIERYMEEDLGYEQPMDEGLHDNLYITSIMMVTDPTVVRYDQRVAAGRATINGASIEPKHEITQLGAKLLQYRIDLTVAAIEEALGR